MGCDGGTIPRRDELVRLKKKPEQKDKDAERQYRWRYCAITQEPLQEPIVMCGLGRLYSKQNVIEHLLEKDKMPESASHIKSIKDVRNLVLTPNPAFNKKDTKNEGLLDTRSAPYICKLIGLEMSGKYRFIALWSCGCVFSERALKEIKTKSCSLCQTPFTDQDVVTLNGNDDEVEINRIKMEARVALRKSKKKDKKVTATETTETKPTSTTTVEKSGDEAASSSATISVKAISKLVEDPSKPGTSSKLVKPVKRIFASDTLQDPALKKLKSDFTVAQDPKASEVYKSLFTTHKSEKEQERAHWVTYNPFYN